MVLLTRADEQGFAFETNLDSPKAQHVAAQPRAALLFFWPILLRQVRISGEVSRVPDEDVRASFQAAPPEIQAMIRACRQSQTIADRATLEQSWADALAEAPKHPYTQALFASAPSMDPERRMARPPISGDPPNPINPPSGCRFRTRCASAMPECAEAPPALVSVAQGHDVACYLYGGSPAAGGSPPRSAVPAATTA